MASGGHNARRDKNFGICRNVIVVLVAHQVLRPCRNSFSDDFDMRVVDDVIQDRRITINGMLDLLLLSFLYVGACLMCMYLG